VVEEVVAAVKPEASKAELEVDAMGSAAGVGAAVERVMTRKRT
jgi:hypothetical protein